MMNKKNSLQSFIFILLGIVLLTSNACKKDKDDSPAPTPEDTAIYFNATIRGKAYTDDSRFADYVNGTSRVVSQNNEELIRIDIEDDSLGTFTFTATGETAFIYIDSNSNRYVSQSGTLTVTKADKVGRKISGNFSTVVKRDGGTETLTISAGKFNNIVYNPF